MSKQLEEFIKKLEKYIEDFCGDSGHTEPDTGAYVFDNEYLEAYADGMGTALSIAIDIKNKQEPAQDE